MPTHTLTLASASDYLIRDETGAVVSIEEARRRFEVREVDDWNMAFGRLARQFAFDLDALKSYYAAEQAKAEGRS